MPIAVVFMHCSILDWMILWYSSHTIALVVVIVIRSLSIFMRSWVSLVQGFIISARSKICWLSHLLRKIVHAHIHIHLSRLSDFLSLQFLIKWELLGLKSAILLIIACHLLPCTIDLMRWLGFISCWHLTWVGLSDGSAAHAVFIDIGIFHGLRWKLWLCYVSWLRL